MGIVFEGSSTWIDRKDNIKKYLTMKNIEIRVERELPDANEFDMHPETYKPKIKQLMREIKPQARSKCV